MTTQFIVVNQSGLPTSVKIVSADGRSEEVFVHSGARPKLPPGFTIDSQFAALNPRITQVSVAEASAQASRLSNLANYFSEAKVGQNAPASKATASVSVTSHGKDAAAQSKSTQ